jgi:hypothetical protein
MLLKNKKQQPQEEEIATTVPTDTKATNGAGLVSEKDTAADDVDYPSGLKLAVLMTSMFIGMFLVSLVRSTQQNSPGVCSYT